MKCYQGSKHLLFQMFTESHLCNQFGEGEVWLIIIMFLLPFESFNIN